MRCVFHGRAPWLLLWLSFFLLLYALLPAAPSKAEPPINSQQKRESFVSELPSLPETARMHALHSRTLADGMMDLSKEFSEFTKELKDDTEQASADLQEQDQLVSDSKDTQALLNSAQEKQNVSNNSSEKAEETGVKAIDIGEKEIKKAKNSRDFWRNASLVLGLAALFFAIL